MAGSQQGASQVWGAVIDRDYYDRHDVGIVPYGVALNGELQGITALSEGERQTK
jgi:hypothetical protein